METVEKERRAQRDGKTNTKKKLKRTGAQG